MLGVHPLPPPASFTSESRLSRERLSRSRLATNAVPRGACLLPMARRFLGGSQCGSQCAASTLCSRSSKEKWVGGGLCSRPAIWLSGSLKRKVEGHVVWGIQLLKGGWCPSQCLRFRGQTRGERRNSRLRIVQFKAAWNPNIANLTHCRKLAPEDRITEQGEWESCLLRITRIYLYSHLIPQTQSDVRPSLSLRFPVQGHLSSCRFPVTREHAAVGIGSQFTWAGTRDMIAGW